MPARQVGSGDAGGDTDPPALPVRLTLLGWRAGLSEPTEVRMYYTYVLLSAKDSRLYVGFTENLDKRIAEHENGKVKSTSPRRPLKLVYYEACLNIEDAVKREKYLKSGFGRNFLKNRLENYFNKG